MSYNPYSGQGSPPGGYGQPGAYGPPGAYGQPAPGYGMPGQYPGGMSPYGTPGYSPVNPYTALPSSYLGWSIANIFIGTFLSFFVLPGLIMGIIATVQSAQVRARWDIGDQLGAERARTAAKGLNIAISIIAGLEILLIVMVVIVATSSSTSS